MATSTTTSTTTTYTTTTSTTTTVELRNTQIAVEVLETDANPELWDTQLAVEVLETDSSPELWNTQIAVEVLEKVPATTTTTTTTTQTESPDETGEWFTDFREYPTNRAPSDWSQGENPEYQAAIVEELSGAVGGKVLTFISDVRTTVQSIVRSFLWDTPGESDGTVEVVAKFREMQISSTGRTLSLSLRDDPVADKRYIVEARYLVNDIFLTSGTDSWTTLDSAGCGSISDKTWYRMRVRIVEFPSYVNIRAKVWADGDAEPGSWQIDYDDTAMLQPGAGKVGIALGLEAYKMQVDWFSVAYGGATAKLPDELPTTTTTTSSTTSHTTTTTGHEYVTDFNRYPIGQQPSDWTELYGGTVSVLTMGDSGQIGSANKAVEIYHKETSITPSINCWTAVPDIQNADVLAKIMLKAGTSHPGRIVFRADASGNGYSVRLAPVTSKIYVDRYVSGSANPLEDNPGGSGVDADEWFWLRAKITTMKTPYDAVRIRGKAWLAGTAETADWDFDAVVRQSPLVTGSGKVGLGNALTGNYFLCDYFHVASGGIEPQWGSTTTTTTEHFWETDFAEYAAGDPPADWTETWNTTSVDTTVETGGSNKALTLDVTSNAKIAASWDDIGSDKATVEVLGLLRTDDNFATLATGLGLRLSGAVGTETGYVVHLDLGNDQLTLRRHSSGISSTVTTGSKTLSVDTWYWVRFRAEGSVLKVRAWAEVDSEPGTWDIDHTDTSPITSGGEAGVCTFNASGEADYFALESDSAQWPIPIPTLGTTTTGTTTTYDVWQTDFSEYTVDQAPSDWTESWTPSYGTAIVRSAIKGYGGKRLRIDSPASAGRYGVGWNDPGTSLTDVEILTRIRNVSGGEQGQRVILRAVTCTDETGYFVELDPVTPDYSIFKYVAGDAEIIATGTAKTFLPDIYQWVRFRVVGTSLKMKFWAGEPGDEPGTWDLEATDGSVIEPGWVGVGNYSGDTLYDVDWFSVADASGGGSAPFPISTKLVTSTTSTTTTSTTTTHCILDEDFSGYTEFETVGDRANTGLDLGEYWKITENRADGLRVEGGQLRFEAISGGSAGGDLAARIVSKFHLIGDFDVEFHGSGSALADSDINHSYCPSLEAWDIDGGQYFGVARIFYYTANENGFSADGTVTSFTRYHDPSEEFKLRVTRTGSVCKVFVWSESNPAWEWNGNPAGKTMSETFTGAIALHLYFKRAYDGRAEVNVDRVRINGGICVAGTEFTTSTTTTTTTTTHTTTTITGNTTSTTTTLIYETDFSEYTVGVAPTTDDWTTRWYTAYKYHDIVKALKSPGGKAMQFYTTSTAWNLLSWDDVDGYKDVEILTRLRLESSHNSGDWAMVLGARGSGGFSAENGLMMLVSGGGDDTKGTVRLYKFVGGAGSHISDLSPGELSFTALAGNRYLLRFRVRGYRMYGKIWKQGNPEPPDWQLKATSTDIPTGGWIGLSAGGMSPGKYRVDFFNVATHGGTAQYPAGMGTDGVMSTTTSSTTSTTTTTMTSTTSTYTTTSTTTTETPDTYWTDFSEHSEDAVPSDWTEVWESPVAALAVRGEGQYGNQYLEIDHSTYGHYFAEWDDASTAYNTDILAKVKFGDEFPVNGNDYFKIIVRQTGGNANKNGYEFRIRPDNDDFAIYNWVNNVASQIGSTGSITIGSGWYWIRFQAIGDTIKARVWTGQPSDEPGTWDIDVTNSAHHGVYGTIGVGSYNGDDTRVDYFGVGIGGSSAPAPVDYVTTSTTTTTTTSTTTTGTTETPMEPAQYISTGALQRS